MFKLIGHFVFSYSSFFFVLLLKKSQLSNVDNLIRLSKFILRRFNILNSTNSNNKLLLLISICLSLNDVLVQNFKSFAFSGPFCSKNDNNIFLLL